MLKSAPPGWFPDRAPPVIPEQWRWAWRAWWRLSDDRPMRGGGLGPLIPGRIPWRDVARWCDRKGGDLDELDAIIREMDTAYLEWHAAAMAKNAES